MRACSFLLISVFCLLLLVPCAHLQETPKSRVPRAAWDSMQAESCFETQGRDELSCRGRAMRQGNALRALRLQP
ncbi:hypothetical protein PRIPAC_76314 [Pristionchus pacificus]|uniref:Uncharacterized protein n=1 Tax=Pristionchus pacificus TaxID=54126 RepID=A0A2A6C935_PRIPA|nr:hypothetical protein PRIPAC_76314 [Pristionchus pacificus]|eukprot:PDM74563.1 hypothetical protein PRIPAC_41919 [Pristionchus pacificus]